MYFDNSPMQEREREREREKEREREREGEREREKKRPICVELLAIQRVLQQLSKVRFFLVFDSQLINE